MVGSLEIGHANKRERVRDCKRFCPFWRIFHILSSEDNDDVISRFFMCVCVWVVVCLDNKKRALHKKSIT